MWWKNPSVIAIDNMSLSEAYMVAIVLEIEKLESNECILKRRSEYFMHCTKLAIGYFSQCSLPFYTISNSQSKPNASSDARTMWTLN